MNMTVLLGALKGISHFVSPYNCEDMYVRSFITYQVWNGFGNVMYSACFAHPMEQFLAVIKGIGMLEILVQLQSWS